MKTETIIPPAIYAEIPYIHLPPAVHDYGAVAMADDTTMTGRIILIKPGEYTKVDNHNNIVSYIKAVVYLTPGNKQSISFAGDEIPAFEFYRTGSILPTNYITNQLKNTESSEMKTALKKIQNNITKIMDSID